jgi:hypothetical protein
VIVPNAADCGCHLVAAKNPLGGLRTGVDLEKALSDGGTRFRRFTARSAADPEELRERGEYTLS